MPSPVDVEPLGCRESINKNIPQPLYGAGHQSTFAKKTALGIDPVIDRTVRTSSMGCVEIFHSDGMAVHLFWRLIVSRFLKQGGVAEARGAGADDRCVAATP